MKKPVTAVIAGFGGRGRLVYGAYARRNSENLQIVGIADINAERRSLATTEFDLSPDQIFTSAEEMFSRPKMADYAFICTQDRDHVPHALAAIQQGYDLLLEKPVSPELDECLKLLAAANASERKVTVCHVLRYTKFYQTIKEMIQSGKLGDVVHINATENVGYWHHAHSFVRGNWRKEEESSPMILAKCCHDMDILLWLMDKKCKTVSSFGGLHHFKSENAPAGATKRCLDGCTCKDDCPFDVEKLYFWDTLPGGGYNPFGVILTPDPTKENKLNALKTGPYGRCVFHCDNDVVDHQTVSMQMEDGSTIGFSMCAFSYLCNRTIHIMGTAGELVGDLDSETIEYKPFNGSPQIMHLHVDESFSGHGGGDDRMMDSLINLARGESENDTTLTSLDRSLVSHFVALSAEKSRKNGGMPIDIESVAQ